VGVEGCESLLAVEGGVADGLRPVRHAAVLSVVDFDLAVCVGFGFADGGAGEVEGARYVALGEVGVAEFEDLEFALGDDSGVVEVAKVGHACSSRSKSDGGGLGRLVQSAV
jgi:hypothetical protein